MLDQERVIVFSWTGNKCTKTCPSMHECTRGIPSPAAQQEHCWNQLVCLATSAPIPAHPEGEIASKEAANLVDVEPEPLDRILEGLPWRDPALRTEEDLALFWGKVHTQVVSCLCFVSTERTNKQVAALLPLWSRPMFPS